MNRYWIGLIALLLLAGCESGAPGPEAGQAPPSSIAASSISASASPQTSVPAVASPGAPAAAEPPSAGPEAPARKPLAELVARYGSLGLTDAHNHGASDSAYLDMLPIWERDAVSRVVLFGDVSEPSAMRTDEVSWSAYLDHPDRFIPFFSGFDLHDKTSLELIRSLLERGFFGLGEIAAASSFSPVVSTVEWKANDPMDGYLPQIYELCAAYKAPILLHIDPPSGEPIGKLEQALDAYPDTTFIFGHINAYNSPDNVEALLAAHPNLYADFFAGFTDLNPESANRLEDFIPLMKKFPDRFLLSTDSGYGLPSPEGAIESMYRVIDLLDDPDVARRIGHDNLDRLVRAEPATKTQLDAIRKLKLQGAETPDLIRLSKLDAGRFLIEQKADLR